MMCSACVRACVRACVGKYYLDAVWAGVPLYPCVNDYNSCMRGVNLVTLVDDVLIAAYD